MNQSGPRSGFRNPDLTRSQPMTSSVRRFSPFESTSVRASLWVCGAIMAAALGLGLQCSAARSLTIASNRTQEPKFKYAGGTEDVLAGCPGTLQLTNDSMTYSCAQRSVAIPYRAIETMQAGWVAQPVAGTAGPGRQQVGVRGGEQDDHASSCQGSALNAQRPGLAAGTADSRPGTWPRQRGHPAIPRTL